MDELKEQICEILFKRSEYTRISDMNGLHQLHEREFDNVAEEILGLFEQRQETRPHENVVNSTLIIDLNQGFSGGNVSVRGDIWEIIKKYKGKTITMETSFFNINISIKK